MRLMGIDYGDARIGIAFSDSLGITAQGHGAVKNTGGKKMFLQIADLAREKGAETIVVGLPKNMDGSEGFRAEATRAFADRLREFTATDIVLWDERLTTVQANSFFNEMNVRGKERKDAVDALAAALILENYMQSIK